MAVSRIRTRKEKVLRSVFEPQISQPTPLLPATEAGEPFGGPSAAFLANTTRKDSPASDQVRWDRAWHAVTSRVILPSSVTVEDSFGTLASESQDIDDAFYSSLSLVLNPHIYLPQAVHTEDILSWHAQQVRQHFVSHVLPLLAACASQGSQENVLAGSIRTLEAAHRQYLYGLSLIARGMRDETTANDALVRFQRDLHAVVGNSWTPGLLAALHHVLRRLIGDILGCPKLHDTTTSTSKGLKEAQGHPHITDHRSELLGLLESLQKIGLAGERFQVLFAELMDTCMNSYIEDKYAGVWGASSDHNASTASAAQSGSVSELCEWVENQYGRVAVEIFSRLGVQIEWSDVESWKETAVGRLASLRIRELFDIVLKWPESRGGIEDLRSTVTTPQRRLQLTDTLSATLQKRLLHPGRSTLYILQTYISMIRAFHALDHSKVLLDRVVHALQLYLCQRDDAIRIVVTGLLSNPKTIDAEENKTKLTGLAAILNDVSQQQRRHADEDDLDWNDMSWVPDPADAGVNYKRPKNEDVVGTLISALGSQDIFIKEFQLIIAERLLSAQSNFQQEVKVLGLLKKRFGEAALQNCDVMMKDIQDSKRVDTVLCKNVRAEPDEDGNSVAFHTKILSRLFWPSLPQEPFRVPEVIAGIQTQYEAGFEHLKSSRKLNWLDHLGSATVQLDLEDRSIQLDCMPYEAAVIYAFQNPENSDPVASSDPARRTFNELWEKLMIDEDLLESALQFWTAKKVIRDVGDQTYVVLERMESDALVKSATDVGSDMQGPEGSQPSPRKAKGMSSKEQEQRAIYWQFIVGMLTNSSPAMQLGQILMMMKMLIPDGCPWNNEELQEFLTEKVATQELEFVGGKYRLPKK